MKEGNGRRELLERVREALGAPGAAPPRRGGRTSSR